jgi:hypothetical protein
LSVTPVLSVLADIPIVSTVATASDNGKYSEGGKAEVRVGIRHTVIQPWRFSAGHVKRLPIGCSGETRVYLSSVKD